MNSQQSTALLNIATKYLLSVSARVGEHCHLQFVPGHKPQIKRWEWDYGVTKPWSCIQLDQAIFLGGPAGLPFVPFKAGVFPIVPEKSLQDLK